jgi:hypothetical protein
VRSCLSSSAASSPYEQRSGWEQLPEGEVVAFPRGERGAHGCRNSSDRPVRLLMISEMTGPNISVYPDKNQVGIFDAGRRSERRFGALFNVADAVADYGGKPKSSSRRQVRGTRRIPSKRRFADEVLGELSQVLAHVR